METTTTTTRTLKHPKLPLKAPDWAWVAAGYQVYSNSDEVGNPPMSSMDGDKPILLQAITHGLTGEYALAWVVQERTRQQEERTRSTAMARLADALTKLPIQIKAVLEPSFSESLRSALAPLLHESPRSRKEYSPHSDRSI